MTNLISAKGLGHAFGDKTLFENLELYLSASEKTALVAQNGAGKSTLMQILAGILPADNGEIIFKKELRLGYLPQNPTFAQGATVSQCLDSFVGVRMPSNAVLGNSMKFREDPAGHRVSEKNLTRWMSRFGLADPETPVDFLSSGQRKRVALAKIFAQEPDIVLLDEITNHLDLETARWLERFLDETKIAVFLITHDRYFLNRVCERILELDNGRLYTYNGNYSSFLEKKQERENAERRHTQKMRNVMRRELEWLRRQPKARGSKAKYRRDAFAGIQHQAASQEERRLRVFSMKPERVGGKILELHQVSKSYGTSQIIRTMSYKFKKSDRIGVVGKNGVGKSTLIKLILNEERPDGGKIVRGDTIRFGHFRQEHASVDPDKRVIESVREVGEYIPLTKGKSLKAEQLLEVFLFPRHRQRNFVGTLSGGEQRRLSLLILLMANPNFLILDEPTNDLDIQTLSVLEDFLSDFPGCLLIVSHDRYFLERLCDSYFIFEGNGKVAHHFGVVSDYDFPTPDVPAKIKTKNKTNAHEQRSEQSIKRKLSFKEQREFKELEEDLEQLRRRQDQLLETIQNTGRNHVDLNAASVELHEVLAAIDHKETRWLELSEYAES